MKKIIIFCIVLSIVFISGCTEDDGFFNTNEDEENGEISNTIKIASWNLQIFGPSKASDDKLIEYYAEKIDNYDICIIQEIRDKSGDAIKVLAEELPGYDYEVSVRAGQSSSKEQYAVFYKKGIFLKDIDDYTAEYQKEMERPPLSVKFKCENWTFRLYTTHLDPDEVYNEFSVMEEIVCTDCGDVILLGDFNADGSYYDENNLEHFEDWFWIIDNGEDTTVAWSSNTYDRIIINGDARDNYIKSGVMKDVNKDQSDHYLVYAEFDVTHG